MSINRNTLFMAVTTATKMLSGIVVFVIMARVLGPHDFGTVIYAFTLASIFVLLVDYGFSQQLLRDIGAAPTEINLLMGRVLVAKVALSIVMLIIGAIYLLLFPKDKTTEIVFLLLLLSSVMASFSEFLNVGFRGIGQFKRETSIATIGAAIHFVLLAAVLLIKANVYWVACTFIVSKVIYLYISWHAYHKYIGSIHIEVKNQRIVKTLKSGFPYAADAGFTNFFQQIDTLIVNHYLGLAGVGLYQAATKWLQGALQFAPVLANVYLPAISANARDSDMAIEIEKKLNYSMLILGLLAWIFFTFFASFTSNLIYGEAYKSLSNLWVFVGVLVFLRYFAATQGILLTANGLQKIRVWAQVCALLVLLTTAPYLIQKHQLAGILTSLILSAGSLILVYTIYGNLKGIRYRNALFSILLLSLILIIFIYLVYRNA